MSLTILGDSIAIGVGGLLGGGKTVAKVGASPQAIAAYSFPLADWIILSMGSNGNDAAGTIALKGALETVFDYAPQAKWIFVLPNQEPAHSTVLEFARAHGNRTITFMAGADNVHPQNYHLLADAALAFMRGEDAAGERQLTPLQKIVQQFDPLLESLISGKPGHRAGVWGQALQESNGNPAAIEKPGSNQGGIGLWQHTGSRRRDLVSFAATRSKPWQDIGMQVRFVAQELLGPESHAWAQIQKTTSIEAATETAMLLYERPATQGGPPTYGTARLDRRIVGAKQALAVILGATKMVDTPATQSTQTEQQLASTEMQLEAAGNQLLASRLPGAAPIVQLIETSIVNPMLPSLNHAFGAQIDSNAVAHGIFNLVVLGLGFLASRFTTIQPKV